MSEIDRFLDQEKNQSSIKPERRSAGFTPAQRSNVVEQEQPQHRTSIDQFLEGAPAQDKGVSGVAKDLSLSIGQGLARLPGTAIAAADSQLTGGRVSKAIDDAGLNFGEQIADRLADHHTEKYKQQQQEFTEAGEGKDFAGRTIDKAAYALQNPALITGTVAQSLPDMIAGGFAGGRLSRASKGKVSPEVGAALGEGYMMMGHQAEDVRSQTEDGLLTPEQRGYVAATGALGALFGWGGNRLARRLGIADADTLIAQGVTPQEIAANIAQMPAKSVPKALVQGAITEGFLEELPQEVSETILENLALGKDWSEGLDDAVVMAPLAGMAMGGPVSGYGAYRSNRDRAAAQQEGGQEQAIEPTPDQPPQAPEGVIEEQAYQASPPPQVQEQYRREGLGFTKPSERMGINPDDGPLSTAAAMAVDNALPHMPPPPIEGEYLAGETPTPMPMDRQVAFDRSSQYTVDAYGNVVDIDGNPVPYQPGDMPQLEAMEPRQETPPKPEMWEVDESGEARRAVNQEEYERQQRERYRTERVDLSSLDRGTEPRQQTRQEIDPIADAKNAWESMNSFQRNRIAQDAMGKRGVVAKNTATKKWQDLSEEEQQAVIRETEEQRNRGSWIDPNTASRADDKPVLQNRDRSSRASIEQMNSIAGNPDYNRLSFSRDFGNGAPVVEQGASLSPEQLGMADTAATSQGRQIPVQYAAIEADQLLASNSADGSPNSQYAEGVEGLSRAIAGNGRVAGLQSAWDRGTAQQYKEAMINDQTHGIDPQVIERMDKPVLVRIMPSDQITENIGDESNISGQSELSSVEQAKTDTRRLDLSLLEFSDDGDITAESAASFINSMPVSERAALLDGDRPSRRAIERLEAAVFQQAYGNDELTRLQAEAVRGEARNIVSGLMQAAPSMARLEGAGIYDIRPLVAEAAEVAINARRSGQPLKQYIEQQDFGRNPEILPILEMMADDYRSSQRMGDKLKALAQLSYSEGNKSSSDMFGEVPKADPQQIMEAAFTGEELRLDGQENAEGMGQQSRPELDAQDTTRPDVDGRGQEVLGEQSAEPEGWRGNYIQAARVARELGIDPRQHKELADLVAAIDAHRAEQQATEEPLLDTYSEQELTEREEARQQAEREQEEQARQEEEAIRQQEEREYIRSQSEQAAENFELGQTAEENITGQRNIFDQPKTTESPEAIDSGKEFFHKGLKIYPANIQGHPEFRWAIQTPENLELEKQGRKSVFGDPLLKTKQEAIAEADRLIKEIEEKELAKQKREEEIRKEKEEKANRKADTIDGFTEGMTALQQGRVRKDLDAQIRIDGVVNTKRGHIKNMLKSGELKTSTIEEPKIKPMSRARFNRATAAEQRDHERRMAEAGNKTTYLVNDYELGKTAYDYANHLLQSQAQPTEQPTAKEPVQESQRTSEYGSKNKLVSQERAEQLRKRLRAKLTQINSGFDPEILAIGAELAAFHIEAGVRKFSDFAQRIAEDLGTTPQNLRRYLRSWYNGARDMLEDNDINIDGMDGPEVVREELAKILDNQTEAVENAERTAGNTEPDSTFNEGTEAQENLQDEERGEVGQGVVETGQAASEAEQEASPSMGDGSTSSTREPSNKPVRSEKSRLEDDAARDTDDTGSLPDSTGGLFAEREGSEDAGRIAESAPSTIPKVNTPRNAKADKASIAQVKEQMPFLTDGQAQDVVFAEKRLRKPDGYGVLFTNGTGTGKTFSGLGIMKRMTMRGKGNILVVTPKQTINAAWIDAAHDFFDLKITALENTNDAGKGIVVTTYANLAENDAIMSRDWDAIVADEAHYLSSSQSGKETKSLQKFRALTLKRGTARARVYAKNRSLVDRMNELDSEASTWEKSDNETLWAKAKDLRKESSKIHEQLLELEAKEQERISSTKKEDMPRAVFLSATPFAYEKNVSWANEFLFDWGGDQDGLGYNSGNNYERFMMQHFGYRMRYNKLTEPESEVDRGLMQRSFNSWLKKEGVLSGRALDSQFDYDRIFIQTENALGTRVDEAIDWLRENNKIAGMPELYERMIKQNFKYHDRMYFLEAIKAREALPIIQQHLDQGRKVVVMHDFKKGGTRNPFRINPPQGEVADAYGLFVDNFSDLIRDFSSLPSPIELLSEEFPDALVYNGDISAKRRVQLQNQFNSDSPDSPRVMIAQGDAMREGVSIHDTTGNYPRVMIHLGMPVKPTAAIQQEGRIYRTGQASNTMFRYLTIGTNWERFAFASRIASRASAAENLALGEQARGLKESFINAYENAGDYPAGFEGEGTGGKSIDQSYTEQLTPWDMAKSVYFGTKRQGRGRSARGREQSEFFATPEPLGMKMVQWADIQGGESTLEPSAGHGAIARWMPENTKNRAIELTNELSSRLALHFDGDLQTGDFMEHHVVNKYDAIVMNPPFGRGGAQAAEHVGKAMKHLNNGGRIVALIPNGPAADKRFDALLQSDEAKGFYLVANIQLPLSTFERAGTAVSSRVIVLEKQTDETIAANLEQTNLDFSNAENINELFDMLEDSEISPRSISQQEATQEVQQEAKVEGKAETWEAKHTKTGKTLYMAKPTESLKREDYLRVRDAAKEHGGYWSRFGKAGFLFSDEESRNNFINDAFNDSDPEIRRSDSVGYIPGQTLRNADSFVSAVEAQFPNLGEATRKLLQLGEQGRKGGVVFVEGKSPKAIAKIYSEKTGIPLAQAEALLSDADTANGFYDVRSGITFLIGGNLNENNAAAVLLHEMLHSDQRANVDRMALDLLANRDKIRSKSLRDFIDRVEYQLAQAGESFNPLEAASYIVEQAVIEGRSQGYTMADNKFLNFIEKTVGKPVADLIRELVKSARQWMLRAGVGIQEITIDDLVQYSITALETNAKQIGDREIQVFNNTESIQRSQSQQDQTNTPEFKRWFGESKVVGKDGKPLVVYHGSPDVRGIFDGGFRPGMRGEVFFAAEDYATADSYADDRRAWDYQNAEPQTIPLYLSIKNPMIVDGKGRHWRDTEKHVQEAKEKGHDGIIIRNSIDFYDSQEGRGGKPTTVYAWFKPNQAKSAVDGQLRSRIDGQPIQNATGNTGDFDPNNPDIRFSRAPAVDTPAFKRWFGDSKVVDNNGKPIIVHHGTGSVFNTFDKDSLGSFTGADSAKGGFFFTSSRDLAQSFQSEAQRQSVDYDAVRERLNELTDKQLAELGDDIDQYNHSFEYDYNNNRVDFINSMVELLRDDMEAWVDDRRGIERHFQKHIGRKPFESGRVVDAYLKIENPLEHNFSENEDAFDEGAITRLIEQAKKQGKDGLILRNMLDAAALDDKGDGYIRSDVYVAFEPEQIKSATDNIGAFNENNPDIRYSRTAAAAAEHVMNVADTLADKVDKWTNKDRVTPKHWTDGQKAAAAKFDTFMPRQPVSARLREIKEVSSKRFMQLVFDQFRPLQDLSKKAFMQAHLSRGSEGSVEAIATRGIPYLKDGAIAVRSDENGFMGKLAKLGDMEEVRKFLMWVAANRAESLMEEGRENLFTDEDIEAMKGFANGTLKDGRIRRVEYANTLRELNKYNKAVLDIAQEAGLINGDARKTWESEFYVPFYRVMQNEDGTVSNQYTYSDDGLLRKEVIKRLKGGKENLGDPLENILYNWNSLISASMKNMAANEALIQGVELGISEPTDVTKGNNIWTLQDGKRVYWEVHDKHVLEALESLNFNGYNNGLMKAAGKFKRMLTTGVTYSPTFRIRSLIRDTLHGMAVSDLSYNPVANMVNGWQKASKDSEVLAQMMAGGGAIRFGSMEEGQSADYMRRMIREGKITEEQILNTPEKFRNAINDFLKRYQELGDRMESVNRAEVYTRVLERTGSHLEASFAARDVMNYTSMGSAAIIRAMAQVLPFFNARMQGLNKLVRGANEDPRRFWGVVGTIGMASAALYLMQAGDDEYDALPDYVRDTYWPIKLGDKWVYIPKPFEVGVLGTVIERATELAVAGDDYQTKDFARTLGSLLINNLSLNPVPQIILPAAEAWYNYDMFRDAPIDSMAMQRLLPEDRYTANTSAGAVFLGQTLGASPQKIEHLVVGYLGWLGIQVLNVSDMLGRTMMDLPSSTKWDMSQSQNWFIVGDFLKEEGSTPSKYSNRFYEVQREINQIYSTANAARGVGDMDRYRELMDDPKMQARTQVSSANNRINLINRQIRNITADKQMSAAEKTQRLRELYNRREAIAKSVDAKSRAS